MYQRIKKGLLSGNQLKLIALIAMTVDHIGAYLIPNADILRIMGRVAFPIFAYMLAEGCRYTGNRTRYITVLAITAVLFQFAVFFMRGTLKQYVLTAFLLSAVLCFVLDEAIKRQSPLWMLGFLMIVCGTFCLTEILPEYIRTYGFSVDYGFWGVLLPVAVFIVPGKVGKLVAMLAGLILICVDYGGVQIYSFCALPLLALYNGKRGFGGMKYFYYAYFPLHLIAIFLIEGYI